MSTPKADHPTASRAANGRSVVAGVNETGSATTMPPASPTPPPPSPPGERRAVQPDGASPGGRRSLGWGLAMVAAGTLWLLSLAGVAIRWELVLPIALVAIGVAVLLGGRGRAHGGLIGLGVVLAVVALVLTTPRPTWVGVGDHTHTVTDLAELEPTYTLGAGSLTLDLRGLELPERTADLHLSAGVTMGELTVRVPPDVTVEGEARVALGEAAGFGRSTSGITPSVALTGPGDGDPVLSLDLHAGIGRVEVTR